MAGHKDNDNKKTVLWTTARRNQTATGRCSPTRKASASSTSPCTSSTGSLDRAHDRTVDQMQQAARSGKQNIVEGYSDAEGYSETEHKLTVVAKGSLEELKEDYRDYLRSHNLEIWGPRHEKYITCQSYFRKHNDTAWYMRQIRGRSDEDICNMALIVIFQALALLRGLIDYQDRKFLEEGGIREQRYRARTESRGYGYKNGKFYGPGTRRKDE